MRENLSHPNDIDWRIQTFASLPSTQDVVKQAILNQENEGLVVQALKQPAGRGRHGKVWEGPIGNLYMSLLLQPNKPQENYGELAFVIAVALSKALDSFIDLDKHKKTLKWPNDILINGLKNSGILLEVEEEALIVGIGLNIFSKPDFAICLNDVAKEPLFINKVRDHILQEISHYYQQWQNDGIAAIRLNWLRQAHGLGNDITARLPKETYKGIFEGLSEDGALILKQENDERVFISAGEVHFASGD